MKKTTYTLTSTTLIAVLIASITFLTACQQNTTPSNQYPTTDTILPYPVYRPLHGKKARISPLITTGKARHFTTTITC